MNASRRRFVLGLSGMVTSLTAVPDLMGAAGEPSASSPGAAALSGADFHLEIGEHVVNVTGRPRPATLINGRMPAPVLRWREGDTVTLRVTNRLAVPSSIHWHGVLVPSAMDGVPGLSFEGIAPGETFVYRFPVRQSGTYWYHSHSRFQEQTGLYGAIVIDPREGERHRVDRDYVVLLSDWTDLDPEHLYRLLKVDSGYFNFHRRTLGDWLRDSRREGFRAALADRLEWGRMRMDPTDIADVSAPAYTYLMNGVPPACNWTALFERGERVRLRFINGSSMSIFDVRIPGLALKVIAADGQDVEPVTVDELRISAGEVIDVVVEPSDERAYAIFAQSIDRTGFALGTLAPRARMRAEAPAMDPRPLLTMADMGRMGGMQGMGGMHDMRGMHELQGARDTGAMREMSERHDMHGGGGTQSMDAMPDMPDEAGERGSDRLDDPGVGLRRNGRRVLSYADLHTLGGALDPRDTSRDIVLHLTGNMERFIWSIDGRKYSESEPLALRHGERVRLIVVNDTMMNHPMHLHGMWGEVLDEDGEFQVRKHTITVQPGQRISCAVTANALGRWAYHCHMLYHMEAGMFREVRVCSARA